MKNNPTLAICSPTASQMQNPLRPAHTYNLKLLALVKLQETFAHKMHFFIRGTLFFRATAGL